MRFAKIHMHIFCKRVILEQILHIFLSILVNIDVKTRLNYISSTIKLKNSIENIVRIRNSGLYCPKMGENGCFLPKNV